MKMFEDSWHYETIEEEDFKRQLDELEKETKIQRNIQTTAMRLTSCPLPADCDWAISDIHDNTLANSKLCVEYGLDSFYLRDCGIETVETVAAKLSGSGLRTTRERALEQYIAGMNCFISEAKVEGKAMFIHRAGKLTSVHGSGYAYIPQNKLYELITQQLNSEVYGGCYFISGRIDHRLTTATWTLEREEISVKYKEFRDKIGSSYGGDFICGVSLSTSDIGASKVEICPLFIEVNKGIPHIFSDGIRVVHEYRKDVGEPLEYIQKKLEEGLLNTLFEDSLKKMQEMSDIEIRNPQNTVISLCNRYAIPRKYGDIIRSKVEAYPTLTAYDIYCCATCSATSLKR